MLCILMYENKLFVFERRNIFCVESKLAAYVTTNQITKDAIDYRYSQQFSLDLYWGYL